MKKRLFLDIETPMITGGSLPDKIFLIVGKDAESKEIFSFTEDKLEDFKTLVSNYDEFVGHNIIGFDAPVIHKVLAIDLHQQGKVIDTLVLSRLFNPVREGGHSLKSWGDALRFDKLDFKDFSQYSDEMLTYCVRDVEVTEKVLTYLIRKYPDFAKEAIRLEHDVSRIITQQERNGFLFDMGNAHLLLGKLREKINEIEAKVKERFIPLPTFVKEVKPRRRKDGTLSTVGLNSLGQGWVNVMGEFSLIEMKEFNLGSRQQIGKYLQYFGWKPTKFTDKGHIIVDEKVLEGVEGIPEAELIRNFLLLQKRIAQVSSWVEAVAEDGRVHGRVITNGAITGRMSHMSPNMAQVPAVYSPYGTECRGLWVVPSGYKLVGVDASGLELRILSHYMNDKEYIDAIINGDIHTTNQNLAGLDTRDQAKTFIYAFIYGAGDEKLGTIVGGNRSDGKKIKERFLRGTPALASFRQRVGKATGKGWLRGIDGRRLIIRNRHSAVNTLIQGGGAIVMKKALILLDDYVLQNKLEARPVANVHDEFQYEVLEAHADDFGKLAVNSIVNAGIELGIRCPLNGEYKSGNNWQETH
jgi:DNA polymerase I-like protein with 3'-5' exonuclease and polymerase domains|tara:strand:- start:4875 stop:6617 length:1743 start_codon:yes stop_codon:yes gene_type:complete